MMYLGFVEIGDDQHAIDIHFQGEGLPFPKALKLLEVVDMQEFSGKCAWMFFNIEE